MCPSTHPYQLPSIRLAFHMKNTDHNLKSPVRVSAGGGEFLGSEFMHTDVMDGAQPAFDDVIRRCVINVGYLQPTPSGCRP